MWTFMCSIGDFEIDWVLECVWELKFGTSPRGSYWVFTFLSSESSLGSKSPMLHIPPCELIRQGYPPTHPKRASPGYELVKTTCFVSFFGCSINWVLKNVAWHVHQFLWAARTPICIHNTNLSKWQYISHYIIQENLFQLKIIQKM